MAQLYGSLCLSDIPKELITTGTNGKKYLKIQVGGHKTASRFGMTHYVKAYVKKEQVRQDTNYYIGELKESNFHWDGNATAQTGGNPTSSPCTEEHKELPF